VTGGAHFAKVRGLRRAPRPLFFCSLLALAFSALSAGNAQDPVRPWLDWRTLATANYRFHYPRELENWTRDVAARVEGIDSAIVSRVGYTPKRPVHVVVDDPFSIPNGYVLPFIDRPVSVWWAIPPDPRSDIGNYVSWGEMLSAHELTHVAHLTRPSRNPLQRQLWSSLPANLGPITRKSPRWVYEGYATMIEGEITGTGRPNNVWRPAILRQWAIEGRLPTYGQLSGWGDFEGGEFAYLGGSAFLEWLAKRQGDSSLVHLWRRMTARIVRGFDASFMGVYGDAPATLYGKHAAELTRDAMAAKAELDRAGLVEGELVQHLSWGTGDPAVSPNGQRVAVTLRERDRPSRVVIWSTGAEPRDTAAERRRLAQQKRDPQDVPDRRFYPAPKKALKTLSASNGRSYGQPRWLADNRRVLVTRWAPRTDGTLGPDVYIWDTESGDVDRVTHGSGVLNADPHTNGMEAVATQCHWGHCDIARVDLARGTATTLLEGDPRRSYYRPRYSPDGTRFVASVSDSGRWRIVIADRDGSHARYVDPRDGANRYDAQWLPGRGDTLLVAVSERGGIPNLELVNTTSASVRALTRVTGAALAPDVNPKDSSIWFLNLQSRGFDVRRTPRGMRIADTAVAITSDRFGFAGLHAAAPTSLGVRTVGPARAYGSGPRHNRWLPGGYYSADGGGGFVTIFSGDIVGRFNATAIGAYGEPGTWQGGSVRAVWRRPRPAIELGAQGFIHEPSSGRFAQPAADSLDASFMQSLIAASAEQTGDGWRVRERLGGGVGVLDPRLEPASHFRGLAFAELELRLAQSTGANGIVERLRGHMTHGQTRAKYQRVMSTIELETTGRDAFPLELSATFGRVMGSPHPFELLTIGGAPSPIADSSLLSQRFSMPMFPTGIAVGKALLAWRVAFPTNTWTWFYEGASATSDLYAFRAWNRALGIDVKYALPPVPVAFAPRIQGRTGAAYTLDAPFRKRIRFFLEMRMEP
jgi:Tol biopolymer transport system component